MNAIPTMYKGVRFRSRLEARWAAFFDEMKWPWKYEPLELDGYIPDFVLELHKPIIAEVKPITSLSGGYVEAICAESREALDKIDKSGWKGEALLLGAWPTFDSREWSDMSRLGLLRQDCDAVDGEPGWWSNCILFRCKVCGRPSFFHSVGVWECRASGCYDGDHHLDSMELGEVEAAWVAAGNTTQWRPRA